MATLRMLLMEPLVVDQHVARERLRLVPCQHMYVDLCVCVCMCSPIDASITSYHLPHPPTHITHTHLSNLPSFSTHSIQEERIRQLLSKPFRVPIPNYTGSSVHRGLGMRRTGMRAALHDPYEEGALVLYTPRELSAHEQLTANM